MNLDKSRDWFNPNSVKQKIHIIGCGSVGSCVAELLARFGLTNMVLYDFDIVEPKNVVNQMFFSTQTGENKVNALKDILVNINADCEKIEVQPDGYEDQPLDGYVFLCVDNIELRHKIAVDNRFNKTIKAVFDCRTGLLDAQHFAADWSDSKSVKSYIKSTEFSHEEAAAETPTSACGITLGVAPTVRAVVNIAVCNFMNFVKGGKISKYVVVNPFEMNENNVIAM